MASVSMYLGHGIYSPDPLLTLPRMCGDGTRDVALNPLPATIHTSMHPHSSTGIVTLSFDCDRN